MHTAPGHRAVFPTVRCIYWWSACSSTARLGQSKLLLDCSCSNAYCRPPVAWASLLWREMFNNQHIMQSDETICLLFCKLKVSDASYVTSCQDTASSGRHTADALVQWYSLGLDTFISPSLHIEAKTCWSFDLPRSHRGVHALLLLLLQGETKFLVRGMPDLLSLAHRH